MKINKNTSKKTSTNSEVRAGVSKPRSNAFVKKEDSSFFKTGDYSLSKSFNVVPEQISGLLDKNEFTALKIKDTLSKKRGSQISNDTCVLCKRLFHIGWLYHTVEGEEFAICNECKAKCSEGKMNFKKQTINCNF